MARFVEVIGEFYRPAFCQPIYLSPLVPNVGHAFAARLILICNFDLLPGGINRKMSALDSIFVFPPFSSFLKKFYKREKEFFFFFFRGVILNFCGKIAKKDLRSEIFEIIEISISQSQFPI